MRRQREMKADITRRSNGEGGKKWTKDLFRLDDQNKKKRRLLKEGVDHPRNTYPDRRK